METTRSPRKPKGEMYQNYLNEHLVAADVGVQAFHAAADTWRDSEHEQVFRQLAEEIESDRQALKDLIGELGHDRSAVRDALVGAAKVAGRVNPLNLLRKDDSSATQLELDALVGAVTTKRMMWETLQQLVEVDPRLDAERIAGFLAGADSQLERIRAVSRATVRQRFLE